MCNPRGVIITQHYEGWKSGGFDGGIGGGGEDEVLNDGFHGRTGDPGGVSLNDFVLHLVLSSYLVITVEFGTDPTILLFCSYHS